MLPIGLNHMTIPNSSTIALLDTAKLLGFVGVELRNDLAVNLFDGIDPSVIRTEVKQRGLRILVLAEVYAFNDNSAKSRAEALALARLAQDCGAEAIALIPRVASDPIGRPAQRKHLRDALDALRPMLEDQGVTALIEPLGFANSSLRLKADVVSVLDDMGRPDCFALIHDTFHHALSGEDALFADATHIVHISGVNDSAVSPSEMEDMHRGLVGQNDRLGSVAQVNRLHMQGYDGPLSFEAFAPEIHKLNDPAEALSASTAFISSQITELVA